MLPHDRSWRNRCMTFNGLDELEGVTKKSDDDDLTRMTKNFGFKLWRKKQKEKRD
jgi:hypothetical protein